VKRLISVVGAFLFIAAALPMLAFDNGTDPSTASRSASARRPVIIDEVIRMSQAGVGDDAIISYVRKYRDRFDVNADDVIALTDAHVSKDVVKEVVDEAASRKLDRRDSAPTTRFYTGVYVNPWYYPSYGYYYDPFFYGPRISFGFGFGHFGRFGGGGHFRGRR
jgi:hypothetical protein